jgi:hypothetical protein
VLHERGISFRRTRPWKEFIDPGRDAKLDRIEYVTSAYPDRCCAAQRRERTRHPHPHPHPQRTPATLGAPET